MSYESNYVEFHEQQDNNKDIIKVVIVVISQIIAQYDIYYT